MLYWSACLVASFKYVVCSFSSVAVVGCAVSAEFSDEVRGVVLERSNGYCEVCGRSTPFGEFHHRLPRKMGGTRRGIGTVKNCLYVCTYCHHYIHLHPGEAYLKGWLLRDTEENLAEVTEQ